MTLRNTILGLALTCALLPCDRAKAQVVETEDHFLTTITTGVYVIRHRNAVRMGVGSGNTTIIVGDRDVLVVDTGILPVIAEAAIARIKAWTNKPVRYVVNTHWHGDHVWGNSAYRDAYPGVTFIAHAATPPLMAGYLPNFIPRNLALPDEIRRALAAGKDLDGSTLSATRRAELTADISLAEARVTQYQRVVPVQPNLTFDSELTLDLGNREVHIRHLGRGNTSGDAIVHIPAENIVIAGDLLVYPNQFFFGGFPSEWSATLDRIAQLRPRTIVPGHGAVLNGDDATNYLNTIKDWLATVSRVVRSELYKAGNLPGSTSAARTAHFEKVRDGVLSSPEIAALRQRYAGEDAGKQSFFDRAMPNVIDAAYREAWGN